VCAVCWDAASGAAAEDGVPECYFVVDALGMEMGVLDCVFAICEKGWFEEFRGGALCGEPFEGHSLGIFGLVECRGADGKALFGGADFPVLHHRAVVPEVAPNFGGIEQLLCPDHF
jgi:hypothetical protein